MSAGLAWKGVLSVAAILSLSACGSSSSGSGEPRSSTPAPPATGQGVFIDSAVQGLGYESGDVSGFTDANGGFTYTAGEPVTFYVGDTIIGTLTLGVNSGAVSITPVDLVNGAVDETDETVTNIAQLLQSLDDDRDPSNGIEITQAMHDVADQAMDISQLSDADFANQLLYFETIMAQSSAGITDLVEEADAQAHLQGSLITLLAGTYVGTYTGDVSGTFTLTFDNDGMISGQAQDVDGVYALSGSANSDGSAAAGTAGDDATFSGTINNGVFSGTWVNTAYGESGTFTGTLQ